MKTQFLMLSLSLVGCGNKSDNKTDNKEENEVKEPLLREELTDEEKARIEEIDAEIAKYTEVKSKATAKCRSLQYGGSGAYNKCIKEAYNKFDESTKDLVQEKETINATVGTEIVK